MTNTYDVKIATEFIRHHEDPRLKLDAARAFLAAIVAAFPPPERLGMLRARSIHDLCIVVERLSRSASQAIGYVQIEWKDLTDELDGQTWCRTIERTEEKRAFPLQFIQFDPRTGRYVAFDGEATADAVVTLVRAMLKSPALRAG